MAGACWFFCQVAIQDQLFLLQPQTLGLGALGQRGLDVGFQALFGKGSWLGQRQLAR